MAKVPEPARTWLRPAPARSCCIATQPGGPPPRRRARRRTSTSTKGRWQGQFLLGFAQGGVECGLRQSGKDFGDAILAWLADPSFRQQVERISAGRMAAAEHKLIDLLLSRLADGEDGAEKSALSIWQQLKDDRRRSVATAEATKPVGRRQRHVISPERAEAAQRAIARAEEFQKLLTVIRARLADAEAATGRNGREPGA